MAEFFAGVGAVLLLSAITFMYLVWRAPLDPADEQIDYPLKPF